MQSTESPFLARLRDFIFLPVSTMGYGIGNALWAFLDGIWRHIADDTETAIEAGRQRLFLSPFSLASFILSLFPSPKIPYVLSPYPSPYNPL